MKLLLVHLSDIHIRTGEESVLRRGEAIVSAIQNLDYEVESVLLVVSGDLAFSGSEEQYTAVWALLKEVAAGLQVKLSAGRGDSPVPVNLIAIPGNHDCDFSHPSAARTALIDVVVTDLRQAREASIVDICIEPQEPFFAALEANGTSGLGAATSDYDWRLAYEHRFLLGTRSVRVICLNTAWLSQRHEQQGKLSFPAEAVSGDRGGDDLVVMTLHHPYNWLESVAARALRKRVEAISDIVLSGHEHDAAMRSQEASTGASNTYVEGGALQDATAVGKSEFNAFVIDLDAKRMKTAHIEWDGDRYSVAGTDEGTGDAFGLVWEEFPGNRLRDRGAFHLADEVYDSLNDPGVTLVHRDRGTLHLDDIFVPPDLLQEVILTGDRQGKIVRGDSLMDLTADATRLLIVGEEQAGKTVLAKTLFKQFHRGGYVPILLDGTKKPLLGERLHAHLVDVFTGQYHPDAHDAYRQLDRSRRVVIVDDYHRLPLKATQKVDFLAALAQFAGRVILLGHDTVLDAMHLLNPGTQAEVANAFTAYRIVPFRHVRRDELVEKWLLLDDNATADPAALAHRRQSIASTLQALVGKGLMPPYPVYMLVVLQSSEATTPFDTRVGTYGAYYEFLIRDTLRRGQQPVTFNTVLNYLAHFAFQLFLQRRVEVSRAEFGAIHRAFEERYGISQDTGKLIEDLGACGIFTVRADSIRFHYKFIAYYFVASWVRDHITEPEIRDLIVRLSASVHVEQYANILLFLAHVSKDPVILEAILEAARSYYPEIAPAEFDGDMAFLRELSNGGASPLNYKDRDPAESRREYLEQLDNGKANPDYEPEEWEDEKTLASDLIDPAVRLNAAFKTVQILGQVLKNFPGSLEAGDKLEIVWECYALALRAFGWLVGELREDKDIIVWLMAEIVREQLPRLSEEQVEERARRMVVRLTEAIGFSLTKMLASAAGSGELALTYDRVAQEHDTAAVHLINAAILLETQVPLPERRIKELERYTRERPYARTILSYLVMEYIQMIPTKIAVKQRVLASLGISFAPLSGASATRLLSSGQV